MFESDKKSSLDRLKKGLYSRNTPDMEPQRHSIHGEHSVVPESWDPAEESASGRPAPLEAHPPRHRRIYKIVFLFSIFLLLAALAMAAYTFFGGGNYISVDNVDILVDGPASIGGGEPLSLNVSVINKNQTEIQLVDLIADYPQGTKDPEDPTKDLSRTRVSLGNIGSQSVAQQTVGSLMFGQEGDVRDIKFTAEYRTADSNAIFFKEKIYHVTISSSPIIVSIDTLDKALGGEPFDMTITVSSNSTATVKNLLLSLDYPFGFNILSSDPASTYSDNIWRLGDLAPGAKRIIRLRAVATGQDGEDKVIHASVGIQSDTNERDIATTIITRDHDLTIEKPFLGVDLVLDGNHDDDIVAAGRTVHGDILWTNNSGVQITNARIVLQLNGNALNKTSVVPDSGGYYDSQANTITWQAGRSSGLDAIAPGADGRVGFSLASVASSLSQTTANPQISVSVSASGNRVDETGTPQEINTAVSRLIKLVSNLALSARALHSQGPFTNTGPVPPHVDQATTYTIVWTVTNTSNNITGAKVTASLPPYVSWAGVITPSDADITYASTSGAIVWNVGEVPRNADVGSGAKQVAFQVSLRPSANQVDSSPELIGQATIAGTDVFTGANLTNSTPSLTTRITSDLQYKAGDDVVQK